MCDIEQAYMGLFLVHALEKPPIFFGSQEYLWTFSVSFLFGYVLTRTNVFSFLLACR